MNFVELAVSGLASMYPALLERGLLAIMDIRALDLIRVSAPKAIACLSAWWALALGLAWLAARGLRWMPA